MKNIKRKYFLILLSIFLLTSIFIYNKTHIKNYIDDYLNKANILIHNLSFLSILYNIL